MRLGSFLGLFLLLFVFAGAGCRTNLFSGAESPQGDVQNQAPPPSPIVVDGMRTSYADVVEKTSPAVVQIFSERKTKAQPEQNPFGGDDFFRRFMPQQQPQQPQIERGAGSGVIVSADGYVLTNHHVIDGADKLTVRMQDSKTYEAKIVGSDPPSDLAVLKIEAAGLPFLTLGNSDSVRVGDIVLAIGNPLGIGQTVTAGIISAKGRRTGLSDGNSSFEDFLQTDAPINRGNSGGALVNLTGELIGINSQILSSGQNGGSIGIGFSIPSNMAKSVMEQLIKDGKVRRGMLGVNIQNLTESIAKSLDIKDVKGVIVSNVKAGSSADKAGVKRGDIITAINGEKIEDGNVLRNKIAGTMPGTEIKLSILRDGQPQELTAKLDEFEVQGENGGKGDGQTPEQRERSSGKLGLDLQPISPAEAKKLQLPDGAGGLLVTEVDPNGPAAEEGVTRGDVILEVNRVPVESLQDMQAALEKSGDRPILLALARRGQVTFLTVTPR